jgi:hypothetical protein
MGRGRAMSAPSMQTHAAEEKGDRWIATWFAVMVLCAGALVTATIGVVASRGGDCRPTNVPVLFAFIAVVTVAVAIALLMATPLWRGSVKAFRVVAIVAATLTGAWVVVLFLESLEMTAGCSVG